MICPECKLETPEGARVCQHCGATLLAGDTYQVEVKDSTWIAVGAGAQLFHWSLAIFFNLAEKDSQ